MLNLNLLLSSAFSTQKLKVRKYTQRPEKTLSEYTDLCPFELAHTVLFKGVIEKRVQLENRISDFLFSGKKCCSIRLTRPEHMYSKVDFNDRAANVSATNTNLLILRVLRLLHNVESQCT